VDDYKIVKVNVPVQLIVRKIDGDEDFELNLQDGSVSTEINIIEDDAINQYKSGNFEELK
jgi:hypothetical protein